MERYDEKIELYFDLKDSPESTREAYRRRMKTFLAYMQKHNRPIDDIDEEDIQQFILHLKKERSLSAGTINPRLFTARP
ncbi:phage integrase N-terminal SAM-like domain-containing protein [Amphibacillus indicireducens]|uniref:Core-binding (CB) domain-containing protein n=1 Tax=Amphibacillus indicireducens TaxID=1076330 RepID=A0ABP7VJB6_9BACI